MTTCCDESMWTRTLSTIISFKPPSWPFAPPDMPEILDRRPGQGEAVGDSTGRGVRLGRVGSGDGVSPGAVATGVGVTDGGGEALAAGLGEGGTGAAPSSTRKRPLEVVKKSSGGSAWPRSTMYMPVRSASGGVPFAARYCVE